MRARARCRMRSCAFSALSGEGIEDLHRALQEMLQPFRTASDAGDDGGLEEFFGGRRRLEFGVKTDWSW